MPLVPRTDTERRRYLFQNLVLHFRPATVAEPTLKFSLTWGLGGMAAVLIAMQIFTGLLLKIVYVPTPQEAYNSIRVLQDEILFGGLIRNLHHWSANLLVLIIFLHWLRVFFTGAFHPPRQFNWVIGFGMLLLVLGANFTGYLLPYDQLGYWAVTVSTGMLEYIPWIGRRLQALLQGGPEIGPATLRFFFAIHTAILPIGLALLMAFHFWRIRKAGGLVIPRSAGNPAVDNPQRVTTLPNLLVREAVTALALIAAVFLLAALFHAPLAGPANQGLSPNPTKAPWYFAGLQEMLLHLHPTFAVLIVPALLTIGVLLIPYLRYDADTGGIWFASHKGRWTAALAAVAALVLTPLLILLDEWIIDPAHLLPELSPLVRNGLLPFLGLTGILTGFWLVLKRRFAATLPEAVQAIFVLTAAAFAVLTVFGVWFREEAMMLRWPW
ncbi:MAG TPA: cytochrome b N-terminal domain-containing protein [Desulfobacterales bacterium]